jgi:peptide deformylase
MSILPILTDPNPILRKKAEEVASDLLVLPQIKELTANMIETMIEAKGVGLAAPQIGRSLRIITVNTDDEPTVLINPRIIKSSWGKVIDEEGCLSVPGKFGLVKRPKTVRVQALDENGKELNFKAKGLLARVIQHEIDHLDGKLFIDKVIKYTNDMQL